MCDVYENIEIWALGPQLSLGDVYLGAGAGNGVFDLPRHHGAINILFADSHTDAVPITSSGGPSAHGLPGSPGNMPSTALMDVSLDKEFN